MGNVDIGFVWVTVATMFILMLIGIMCCVFKVLEWQALKQLSNFVINIAQPMLILCAFQTEFTSEKLEIGISLLVASAIILVATSLLARLFSNCNEKADKAVFEFGMIFANWSYLSYPILYAVFGDNGYFYGAFFTLAFNVYIRLYGIILFNKGKKKGSIFKSVILNPGTLAAIIGVVLFLANIKIPAFLYKPMELVGDLSFPLSMLVVGGLICNQPLIKLFKPKLYLFALFKLLLLPLITLVVCALLNVIFGFDRGMSFICVIMACLPTSPDTALFSEHYKSNSSLGANCVGITTLFAVVTIPLMLWATNALFNVI